MDFLEVGTSSEQLLFQNKNFIKSWYFLKTVSFSDILKYALVCFDFEIPQSFVVENSKWRINFYTGCVTNVNFSEVDSNLVFSHKLQKIVLTISVALMLQKMLQWEFVEISKTKKSTLRDFTLLLIFF